MGAHGPRGMGGDVIGDVGDTTVRMSRLVLIPVLLLFACGDDGVVDPTTTGGGGTSTGAGPTTTGGGDGASTGAPTTGGSADATGSSGGGTSTGTTQGGDATTSSTGGGSTSSGEVGGSTSTGETTGESTGTGTGTGTSTGETTGESTGESTGDESTGNDTDANAPVPMGMCVANDVTMFVAPMPGPEELHIVGVYQPTNGAITVDITRAGVPLTLVLNSYEPVNWTLTLAPGVLLAEVILDGYNAHTVQGQGGATVTDLSGQFMYLAACGYFWPMNDGGCDTPGLVAAAEQQTGLELASFVGCYEGAGFSIG